MTYFEEKGFGFLRPDGGGKDIFFHISRLHQGEATELVPGTKVAYDLGMDRNGKIAASSVRLLAAEEKPALKAPAALPPVLELFGADFLERTARPASTRF